MDHVACFSVDVAAGEMGGILGGWWWFVFEDVVAHVDGFEWGC